MSNRHRCCVSLLHKNIWIQLEKGGSQRILQKWAGPKLTGVSGDTLSVRSCARVSLHLDGKRFDVTFVVVDGILVDAILGLDFLEANGGGGGGGGIIDCGRKLLTLLPKDCHTHLALPPHRIVLAPSNSQ